MGVAGGLEREKEGVWLSMLSGVKVCSNTIRWGRSSCNLVIFSAYFNVSMYMGGGKGYGRACSVVCSCTIMVEST